MDEAAHAAREAAVDLALCMSVHPGYSGQAFIPESLERVAKLRSLLPQSVHVQVDGGVGPDEHPRAARRRRDAVRRRRRRSSDARTCRARTGGSSRRWREPRAGARARGAGARIGRADAPARRRGARARRRGRRRGLVRGAQARRTPRSRRWPTAGERARGATLYVSLEPCSHHGSDAAVRRRGRGRGGGARGGGSRRPEPEGRRARLRAAPRGRGGGRGRRSLGGTRAERGLARLDRARAAVRDLQGGDDARRARRPCPARAGSRARRAAAACTSCGPRWTPSRSGWAPCGRTTPR